MDSETFYCLKFKKQSTYTLPETKINKRNVKYVSAICDLCTKKHNRFLKSDKKKDVNQTELNENLEIIQPAIVEKKEKKPRIKKEKKIKEVVVEEVKTE